MRPFSSRRIGYLLLLIIIVRGATVRAEEFQDVIGPYLKKYCVECHTGEKAKAELDLSSPASAADVIAQFRRWQHMIEFVRSGEMPPDGSPQPDLTETNRFVSSVREILLTEAGKQAGDPGVVMPRRLSNSEFDYAIRDLTGVDIRPTRDFPADPAGGEGFDNTGEALRMSPNLLKKYLAAAQRVSEHLVLKPNGVVFAPFPVTSYNERKKLTEQAVIDFYQSHAVNFGDYLEAAWRFRYRSDAAVTLEQFAKDRHLSGRYLSTVWNYLESIKTSSGWARELANKWESLAAPVSDSERSSQLLALIDSIQAQRALLSPPSPELIKANAGNWPIQHLDFRAKVAASRNQFHREAFRSTALVVSDSIPQPRENGPPLEIQIRLTPELTSDTVRLIIRQPIISRADHLPRNDDERKNHKVELLHSVLDRLQVRITDSGSSAAIEWGRHPVGHDIDPDSIAVSVPSSLSFSLTAEMQRELAGMRLLLPCEIDREHSSAGDALITVSPGDQPRGRSSTSRQYVIHPASELVVLPSAEAFCRTFPDEFFHVDRDRGLAAALLLPAGRSPRDGGAALPVLMDPYGGPHAQRVVQSLGLVVVLDAGDMQQAAVGLDLAVLAHGVLLGW